VVIASGEHGQTLLVFRADGTTYTAHNVSKGKAPGEYMPIKEKGG
jgi:hypothetical protein